MHSIRKPSCKNCKRQFPIPIFKIGEVIAISTLETKSITKILEGENPFSLNNGAHICEMLTPMKRKYQIFQELPLVRLLRTLNVSFVSLLQIARNRDYPKRQSVRNQFSGLRPRANKIFLCSELQ